MAQSEPVDDSFLDEQDDSFLDEPPVSSGQPELGPDDDPSSLQAWTESKKGDDFGAGFGSAVIEGAADAIPGTSQLGAALHTGPEVADALDDPLNGKKWGRIVDAYRAAKTQQEGRSRAAQANHPWAYLGGNLPAAVGAGVATGGASRIAPMMTDVALATGQAANQGDMSPTGIAGNVLGGRAMVGAVKVGANITKHIADALQLPLGAAEELFYRFGGTRLAKFINKGADAPEGNVISQRVQELRDSINAPNEFKGSTRNADALDLGPVTKDQSLPMKLGEAAERGDATLGEGSNFSATPKAGIEDELYSMERGTIDRAAEKQWPGGSQLENPFIQKADDAKNLRDTPIDEMFAGSNEGTVPRKPPSATPDPNYGVRGPNVKHKGTYRGQEYKFPEDRAGWENVPHEWKSGPDDSEASGGIMDLMMKETESPNTAAGIAALKQNEMGASRARWDIGPKEQSAPRNPRDFGAEADALEAQVATGSAEANTDRSQSMTNMVSDARKWQQKIAAAKEGEIQAAGNRMEQQRLAGKAQKAQQELDQLDTGRGALGKVAGALSGGSVGYGAGKMSGVPGAGILTGMAGAAKGYESGVPIAKLAEVAAQLGQMATRDGPVGKAAQWAMSAGDQHAAMTRIAILMKQPWFQSEMGTDR